MWNWIFTRGLAIFRKIATSATRLTHTHFVLKNNNNGLHWISPDMFRKHWPGIWSHTDAGKITKNERLLRRNKRMTLPGNFWAGPHLVIIKKVRAIRMYYVHPAIPWIGHRPLKDDFVRDDVRNFERCSRWRKQGTTKFYLTYILFCTSCLLPPIIFH